MDEATQDIEEAKVTPEGEEAKETPEGEESSSNQATTTTQPEEKRESPRDQRHLWILKGVSEVCNSHRLDEYSTFLDQIREPLEELLADRTVFKYLFLWKSENPQPKAENPPIPLPTTLDLDDEEDELVEAQPQQLQELGFKLDVDRLSEHHSPAHFQAFLLARKKRGYIPTSTLIEQGFPCAQYLRFGFCRGSAFEHLQAIIRDHRPMLETFFASKSVAALKEAETIVGQYLVAKDSTEGLLNVSMELCPFLFQVPFDQAVQGVDAEELDHLRLICSEWSGALSETIDKFQQSRYQDPDPANGQVDNVIQVELEWWEERLHELDRLQRLFGLPANQRLLFLLGRHDQEIRHLFNSYIEAITELHDEAKDNTTTLVPIAREVALTLATDDFQVIQKVLKKILKTLRHAWMLSKQYNSDEKIVVLLEKITDIILSRARNSVKLEDLDDVTTLRSNALAGMELLQHWQSEYHRTRLEIESSGRENRWELPVHKLFAQVNHVHSVCEDVSKMSQFILNLRSVFSDKFELATKDKAFVQSALDKIEELKQTFVALNFEVFSRSESHHWTNHLNWFYREIRFLEIRCLGDIDEVFDNLESAETAILAVQHILGHDFHPLCFREAVTRNRDKVMDKFTSEISQTKETFVQLRASNSPPSIPGLPPIAGSILWTQKILDTMQVPLDQMSAMAQFTDSPKWTQCAMLYESFLDNLKTYQQSRYQEWCLRVSDILTQNLTRSLLIEAPPSEETGDVAGYAVNFTTDLSDTLAEVKYLESQGFSVPESARNMSIQESKFLKLETDLQTLVELYGRTVGLLDEPERVLMREEIQLVRNRIWPGQDRLTWNSLGTRNFIDGCTNQISILLVKVEEVNKIRDNIAHSTQELANGQLLSQDMETAFVGKRSVPTFEKFLTNLVDGLQRRYRDLLAFMEDISPNLLKVEEALFRTRSMRAPQMALYYQFWDQGCYNSVVSLVLANLDSYLSLLGREEPSFSIQVVLLANEVFLQPDPANVIELVLSVVKKILEGTRLFKRHFRGTWIYSKSIIQGNSLKDCGSTFYDDIVMLPEVKDKVSKVQSILTSTIKSIHIYLNEWKSFRNLWLFSKESTCQVFVESKPSCVKFDEKLLFYYNVKHQVMDKPDAKQFQAILLDLTPLKMCLLNHIQEWIDTLGIYLEKTSKDTLSELGHKVTSLSGALVKCTSVKEMEDAVRTIASIEDSSLEIELAFKDMEERFRTLSMYDIKARAEDVHEARVLPNTWNSLFLRSKHESFRLRRIVDLVTKRLKVKVAQFAKKVRTAYADFNERGPTQSFESLDQSNAILTNFGNRLQALMVEKEQLVRLHRVLKLPMPKFPQLRSLSDQINQNVKILIQFNEFHFTLGRIRTLHIDDFPQQVPFLELSKLDEDLSTTYPRPEDMDQNAQLKCLTEMLHRTQHSLRLVDVFKTHSLTLEQWNRHIAAGSPSKEGSEIQLSHDLASFLAMEPEDLDEKLSLLLEAVQLDLELSHRLEEIQHFWAEHQFQFEKDVLTTEPFKVMLMIGNLKECLQISQAHLQETQVMAHMKRAAYIMDAIQALKSSLQTVVGVLGRWNSVQEGCINLVRILFFQPIQGEAERQHLAKFDEDFKHYSRMMSEVTKRPSVLKSCLDETRDSQLQTFEVTFARHSVSLKGLVEERTRFLPRLRFLPFQKILSIFGGWARNESAFDEAVCHIFGAGVTQLLIQKSDLGSYQCSLVLATTQVFPLLRQVVSFKRVEEFLSNVLQISVMSMEYRVKVRALSLKRECCVGHFGDILEDTEELHQISLVQMELAFTYLIEGSMEHHDDRKNLFKKICAKMGELILAMEDPTRGLERRHFVEARNFWNWLRSKREILTLILDHRIHNPKDYQWQSVLRYYWDDQRSMVLVQQGRAKLPYGYEFQDLDTLAYEVDSWPRSQYAMCQAIARERSILIQGPVSAGKRSLFVNLAKRLGQFYVAREILSPDHAMASMLTFLASVFQAGCWGLMAGLECLQWQDLCSLSNTFRNLHDAYSKRLKEVELVSHQRIKMGLSAVLAMKIKPDQLHSSCSRLALPSSLTQELRIVSVQMPAFSSILLSEFPVMAKQKKQALAVERGVKLLASHVAFHGVQELRLLMQVAREARHRLLESQTPVEQALIQSVVVHGKMTGDAALEDLLRKELELAGDYFTNLSICPRVLLLSLASPHVDTDNLLRDVFGTSVKILRTSSDDCTIPQFWGHQSDSGRMVRGRLDSFLKHNFDESQPKTLLLMNHPKDPENRRRLNVLSDHGGFCTADNVWIEIHENVSLVVCHFQELALDRDQSIGLPMMAKLGWSTDRSLELSTALDLDEHLQDALKVLLDFWQAHTIQPYQTRIGLQRGHQFKQLWYRLCQRNSCDSNVNQIVYCFLWSFGLDQFYLPPSQTDFSLVQKVLSQRLAFEEMTANLETDLFAQQLNEDLEWHGTKMGSKYEHLLQIATEAVSTDQCILFVGCLWLNVLLIKQFWPDLVEKTGAQPWNDSPSQSSLDLILREAFSLDDHGVFRPTQTEERHLVFKTDTFSWMRSDREVFKWQTLAEGLGVAHPSTQEFHSTHRLSLVAFLTHEEYAAYVQSSDSFFEHFFLIPIPPLAVPDWIGLFHEPETQRQCRALISITEAIVDMETSLEHGYSWYSKLLLRHLISNHSVVRLLLNGSDTRWHEEVFHHFFDPLLSSETRHFILETLTGHLDACPRPAAPQAGDPKPRVLSLGLTMLRYHLSLRNIVLLLGPTGVGKRSVAKAWAEEIQSEFQVKDKLNLVEVFTSSSKTTGTVIYVPHTWESLEHQEIQSWLNGLDGFGIQVVMGIVPQYCSQDKFADILSWNIPMIGMCEWTNQELLGLITSEDNYDQTIQNEWILPIFDYWSRARRPDDMPLRPSQFIQVLDIASEKARGDLQTHQDSLGTLQIMFAKLGTFLEYIQQRLENLNQVQKAIAANGQAKEGKVKAMKSQELLNMKVSGQEFYLSVSLSDQEELLEQIRIEQANLLLRPNELFQSAKAALLETNEDDLSTFSFFLEANPAVAANLSLLIALMCHWELEETSQDILNWVDHLKDFMAQFCSWEIFEPALSTVERMELARLRNTGIGVSEEDLPELQDSTQTLILCFQSIWEATDMFVSNSEELQDVRFRITEVECMISQIRDQIHLTESEKDQANLEILQCQDTKDNLDAELVQLNQRAQDLEQSIGRLSRLKELLETLATEIWEPRGRLLEEQLQHSHVNNFLESLDLVILPSVRLSQRAHLYAPFADVAPNPNTLDKFYLISDYLKSGPGLKNSVHQCILYDPHRIHDLLLDELEPRRLFYLCRDDNLADIVAMATASKLVAVTFVNANVEQMMALKMMTNILTIFVQFTVPLFVLPDAIFFDLSLRAEGLKHQFRFWMNLNQHKESLRAKKRNLEKKEKLESKMENLFLSVDALKMTPMNESELLTLGSMVLEANQFVQDKSTMSLETLPWPEAEMISQFEVFLDTLCILSDMGALAPISLGEFVNLVKDESISMSMMFQRYLLRLTSKEDDLFQHILSLGFAALATPDRTDLTEFLQGLAKIIDHDESPSTLTTREVIETQAPTDLKERLLHVYLQNEAGWDRERQHSGNRISEGLFDPLSLDAVLLIALIKSKALHDWLSRLVSCLPFPTELLNTIDMEYLTQGNEPLLLILDDPYLEPSHHLASFAASLGLTQSKICVVSSGSDALDNCVLSMAIKRSQWLIIQNLSAQSILGEYCTKYLLESKFSRTKLESNDFRLIITTTREHWQQSCQSGHIFVQEAKVVVCDVNRAIKDFQSKPDPKALGGFQSIMNQSLSVLFKTWRDLSHHQILFFDYSLVAELDILHETRGVIEDFADAIQTRSVYAGDIRTLFKLLDYEVFQALAPDYRHDITADLHEICSMAIFWGTKLDNSAKDEPNITFKLTGISAEAREAATKRSFQLFQARMGSIFAASTRSQVSHETPTDVVDIFLYSHINSRYDQVMVQEDSHLLRALKLQEIHFLAKMSMSWPRSPELFRFVKGSLSQMLQLTQESKVDLSVLVSLRYLLQLITVCGGHSSILALPKEHTSYWEDHLKMAQPMLEVASVRMIGGHWASDGSVRVSEQTKASHELRTKSQTPLPLSLFVQDRRRISTSKFVKFPCFFRTLEGPHWEFMAHFWAPVTRVEPLLDRSVKFVVDHSLKTITRESPTP